MWHYWEWLHGFFLQRYVSFLFLTQYIKTAQLYRGGQNSFCLMFSFILVKRKTTDSEFKYCSCDYQLYKTKQRERVIYKIIFFFSIKKKKILVKSFSISPHHIASFSWKGKILHVNEVMIQELVF